MVEDKPNGFAIRLIFSTSTKKAKEIQKILQNSHPLASIIGTTGIELGDGRMRNYEIYSIKKEFAHYFYLREQKIYQLFKEFQEAKGKRKEIIAKQIDYITEGIPALAIHHELIRQLQYRKDFLIEDRQYIVRNKRSTASLIMFDRKLTLQASGALDGEMLFMEILTNVDGYFLALELEQERYGWIKLVKERNYS